MPVKSLVLSLLFATVPLAVSAQQSTAIVSDTPQPTIAHFFKLMPDSLLPSLSANARLDMVDFMEAGMRAEVSNLLDGDSEMTLLTNDSLSIRVSSVLQIDMQLIEMEEPVDSSNIVISLTRTYHINERQAVSIVDVYSTAWRLLSSQPLQSSLLRRFEEVFSPEAPQR